MHLHALIRPLGTLNNFTFDSTYEEWLGYLSVFVTVNKTPAMLRKHSSIWPIVDNSDLRYNVWIKVRDVPYYCHKGKPKPRQQERKTPL